MCCNCNDNVLKRFPSHWINKRNKVSAALGEYEADYIDKHPQVGMRITAHGLLVFMA